MNGSSDNATKRTAGKAYDSGTGYTFHFAMYGNNWTTIHPAPNNVYPESTISSRKGAGCIIFDTYMDDSITANDALTITSGSISTRRWIQNISYKYGISYDFDKTGGGTQQLHAEADNCINKLSITGPSSASRKMSGDRVNYGSDKNWSF